MNRQELDYYARSYGIPLLMVLCIITLLTPILMRTWDGSPITPQADSYSYLRQAELLAQGKFFDPLNPGITITPYSLGLAIMGLFGVPWLFPIILAILLLLLLYILMEHRIHSMAIVITVLTSIVISPTFSDIGTSHSPVLLSLVFIAAAGILLEKHKIASAAMLFLAAISDPVSGMAACIVIGLYSATASKRLDSTAIGCAVALILAAIYTAVLGASIEFVIPLANSDVLFEFGNKEGISIFFLLLAAYGMMTRPSFQNAKTITVVILVVAASMFLPALVPATVIMLSILTGYAIIHLATVRWELELLQKAMVTLVLCIGLFLAITNIRDRISNEPDSATAHALLTIKNQHREGAVLTAWQYAPLVNQISDRKAVLRSKNDDIELAFLTRDPTKVYSFLEQNNVGFILITDDMRQSIFRRSDEGILFLLDNSARFVKIESDNDASIYYFIRQK